MPFQDCIGCGVVEHVRMSEPRRIEDYRCFKCWKAWRADPTRPRDEHDKELMKYQLWGHMNRDAFRVGLMPVGRPHEVDDLLLAEACFSTWEEAKAWKDELDYDELMRLFVMRRDELLAHEKPSIHCTAVTDNTITVEYNASFVQDFIAREGEWDEERLRAWVIAAIEQHLERHEAQVEGSDAV